MDRYETDVGRALSDLHRVRFSVVLVVGAQGTEAGLLSIITSIFPYSTFCD